ncbi:MAG: hypothetical protein ACT4QF_21645 [Sporichthyaceae bacterium]
MDFTLPKPGPLRRGEASSSAREWIERRKSAGFSSIALLIPGVPSMPDQHTLAAFANAGQCGLLATSQRKAELWQANWSVGDRENQEQRIRTVLYDGRRISPLTAQVPALGAARAELVRSLQAAEAFAADEDLPTWRDWFHRALNMTGAVPYHPDMVPSEYPDDARQVLAMAAQAWVFGGMGSWNDLGFPGEARRRYLQVTRELYDAVLSALLASVNFRA